MVHCCGNSRVRCGLVVAVIVAVVIATLAIVLPLTLSTSGDGAASSEQQQVPQNITILVLGAGMAGLAAANQLKEKGYTQIIVLDARDRIGGRIVTNTSLGWPLDMGASWIHGIKGNPITQLAKNFNVVTVATDDDNGIQFFADGTPMSDNQWSDMEDLYNNVYDQVAPLQDSTDQDMPLQDAFNKVLSTKFPDLTDDELYQVQFYAYQETSLEYGADTNQMSLWWWDQDQVFGGRDVIFPGGYHQLTDGLAAGLDLRLFQNVTTVHYGSQAGGGVKVETASGEVYQADRAIITLPLGVLKASVVTFDPPLPTTKQTAINRLAMGVLVKVYFLFPTVFWGEDLETISYLGDNLGEWCDWRSYVPFTEGQPILMAFHGGAKGWALEQQSDDDIRQAAMASLRIMFGSDIPDPVDMLVTRWGLDPWTRGSYSYIPPFASGDDYRTLATPVDNVLFFAGEATNQQYPSTVHGAYLSGIRAANEVISM